MEKLEKIDKIEKIKEGETTKVVSFGSKDNILVVETVASFINMMNYINTTSTIIRFTDGAVEQLPNYFEFDKSREYRLVYSQVIKIILDGKEVEKTDKNFQRVLDLEKNIFHEILSNILDRSSGVGFSLSKMTSIQDIITKL